VGFAWVVFGLTFWAGQRELVEAVARHDRVSCRSGHKVGKTLAVCVIAWWFCCTRPEARVFITAPTDNQIRKFVWHDIERLWRMARARGFELPEPPLDPRTGIKFNGGTIVGFSTDRPDNMGGASGADLLFLIDEASGVSERIFEAIHGNTMGGAKMVMTGNPTQIIGQFFDSHNKERAIWKLLHLSSERCAEQNVGDSRIRGLADAATVAQKKLTWGVDDPRYQVRVAGNFPTQATNTIVSLGALEAAYERRGTVEPSPHLAVGVDVARFGDDNSVVRPVRGLVAEPAKVVHGFDSIQVAGLVKQVIDEYRDGGGIGRVSVRIDAGGGYGGGVFDQLSAWNREGELGPHVELIELSPSSKPVDDVRFVNRRDEMWFGIADWLSEGGTLNRDEEPPEVEEDLLGVRYAFERAHGRIKVEAKDDIKKRIGRSTDQGDALALAVVKIETGLVDIEHDIIVHDEWATGTYGF
jgi:phage terminase large subunit